MYKFPDAMLSPGELVKGHEQMKNKCKSCHDPFWGLSNEKCIACHKLDSIGKTSGTNITKTKISFHALLENQKCSSCHSDHNGLKPALPYNGFKHEILNEALKSQCNNCHPKPVDDLHSQISAECSNCHNTDSWKSSANFNHDLIQGVDKNNCITCHKTPNDTFHGKFKDNCSKCHNTRKWIPSTFDHSSYFILDQNHNAECNICHGKSNFSNYTCYGCHEHSENNLRNEHNEEGIYNISGCLTCHKSGNKHELIYRDNSKENSGNKREKNEDHEDKDDD